jgi:hypothetical protein
METEKNSDVKKKEEREEEDVKAERQRLHPACIMFHENRQVD